MLLLLLLLLLLLPLPLLFLLLFCSVRMLRFTHSPHRDTQTNDLSFAFFCV